MKPGGRVASWRGFQEAVFNRRWQFGSALKNYRCRSIRLARGLLPETPDRARRLRALREEPPGAVAAGLGLPYELVSGDLEGVTYSSIRAGLIEFRCRVEQFQHNVVVHASDGEMATALADPNRQIAGATERISVVRIQSSKGL